MILTVKLERYQHYHQVKLIIVNILQVKKYYQSRLIEKAKFTYSLFGKALEKNNNNN